MENGSNSSEFFWCVLVVPLAERYNQEFSTEKKPDISLWISMLKNSQIFEAEIHLIINTTECP